MKKLIKGSCSFLLALVLLIAGQGSSLLNHGLMAEAKENSSIINSLNIQQKEINQSLSADAALKEAPAKQTAAAEVAAQNATIADNAQPTSTYTAIDEARYIIQNYYVNSVPDSVLNLPTINDIVKGLNDPYSAYFTAAEYNDFVGRINNTYCGIGVYIDVVPEGLKVTGVMDNSPALAVGIKSGDIIIKADNHSLAGLSAEQAIQYIKGPENSTVAIEISRDGKINDFIVTRKSINAPTVDGSIINNHTAYIRIASFGDATPTEFKNKLDELKKSSPDRFIVDLRDNGGGYTDSAYDIAGYFIGANPVVKMVDRDNNVDVIKAIAHDETVDKPTIFLVNENTASASEILSAAVKDYNKAYFIGTVTYGKGCAQNMYQLSDGSVLKITVRNFYSPNGNTIQKVGITPDLKVEDSADPSSASSQGVDSLAVALLLSGNSGSSANKRGYIKVKLSNQYFEINLGTARKSEYSSAISFIINSCDKNELYIGTEGGWVKASNEYLGCLPKLLSADFDNLPDLNNVPSDKKFTVAFNTAVDITTISKSNLSIVDSASGNAVDYDMANVDDKTVTLKPKAPLTSGHTYYIVVGDGIKGMNGQIMKTGVIVKSTVK